MTGSKQDGFMNILEGRPWPMPGAALPRFATRRWSGRAAKHGDGLVVFLADQCPYLGDATQAVKTSPASRRSFKPTIS